MDDCRPGICHRRCWRGIEPAKITTVGAPASATATKPENSAIIAYRKFLEDKDVSAGNIDARIREFISAFKDMRRNLRERAWMFPNERAMPKRHAKHLRPTSLKMPDYCLPHTATMKARGACAPYQKIF